MVNWQITAKTIYCAAVKDEVTLMVKSDGSSRCTAQKKLDKSGNMIPGSQRCDSDTCPHLNEYRDRLFAEETS